VMRIVCMLGSVGFNAPFVGLPTQTIYNQ
jgi:hypothetical protein